MRKLWVANREIATKLEGRAYGEFLASYCQAVGYEIECFVDDCYVLSPHPSIALVYKVRRDRIVAEEITPKCANCRFAEAQEDGNRTRIYCRRFPPTMVGESSSSNQIYWGFPELMDDQWCGEWQFNPHFTESRAVNQQLTGDNNGKR